MSKVLVVANETVGAEELLAELRQIERHKASEYLVMVPARPLHEEHGSVWTQEGAQEAAKARLDHTLGILHAEGLDATGTIGDCRPLHAIADALMDFEADRIVISTHPTERSRWLRSGLVESARKRFGVPVVHVVSHVAAPARG
jgi:GABA permease